MNLWGDAFEIKNTKETTKKLLAKSANPKKATQITDIKALKSKKISIEDKLKYITNEVNRVLGVYKSNTICIYTREELHKYIDKAIDNGVIAIDTETNNSLDPLTCLIMGGCIYTPGEKNAYIPINHTDLQGNKLINQCTEADLKEELDRLINTNIIMHNGKFDYEVLKCTCNLDLRIFWDTMIASKVLDENERAGLKQQYIEKIDPSIEKYSIDKLFEGIEYKYVDPEIFALYSATDAYMTYKLYEYQLIKFSQPDNYRLYKLFIDIEMPVVTVVANMELTGVALDIEYSKRLSAKYHNQLNNIKNEIDAELAKYDAAIANWRLTPEANKREVKNGKAQKSKNEQLKQPINVSSTTQLAILLYDVLNVAAIDKSNPRGTAEEILEKINLPITKLILQQRSLHKLINTYIDKLPECISPRDGRLHARFNQFGADTGRFSSSDPNLQNIPSYNNEIRLMFTAADGYVMVGSDYSQQEPRLLSHYSQDANMINAYKQGKDLYATVAAKVYHNNYEDNLEFNPITKQMQPDGKHRRSSVKSLLLGIMYGMGSATIAENIGCSIEEAETIKQGFFNEFPNVEQWITETREVAHKTGYVEDVWGRRRRLSNLLKDKFEITYDNNDTEFNPLIGATGKYNTSNIDYTNILARLNTCKYKKEIDQLKNELAAQHIYIKDNTGHIAQAERQCINARIQGGAATMSKRAMVRVTTNQELKNLGFRLLIAVHDELIGECPIENKERVKELLSYEMIEAAKPEVAVPMKCDADDFPSWYYDVYASEIKKEYANLNNNIDILCSNHTECTREQLEKIIL